MTHRFSVRRAALTCAAAVLTVALSGCMKMANNVELNADGSGVARIEAEFGEQISAMMRMGGEELTAEDLTSEMPPKFKDRMSVELDTDSANIALELTFEFENPDELGELFLGSGDATGEDPLFTSFELTDTGDGWKLDAVAPSAVEEPPAGEGDEFDDAFAEFGEAMGAGFELTFSITFPGKVTDHNADTVDGSTATWDLAEGGELHATSTASSGMSPLILAVAGVLLLVVACGAVAVLRSRGAHRSPHAAGVAQADVVAPARVGHVGEVLGGPAAGWYADPADPGGHRYWDGNAWTNQTN